MHAGVRLHGVHMSPCRRAVRATVHTCVQAVCSCATLCVRVCVHVCLNVSDRPHRACCSLRIRACISLDRAFCAQLHSSLHGLAMMPPRPRPCLVSPLTFIDYAHSHPVHAATRVVRVQGHTRGAGLWTTGRRGTGQQGCVPAQLSMQLVERSSSCMRCA